MNDEHNPIITFSTILACVTDFANLNTEYIPLSQLDIHQQQVLEEFFQLPIEMRSDLTAANMDAYAASLHQLAAFKPALH